MLYFNFRGDKPNKEFLFLSAVISLALLLLIIILMKLFRL